MSRATQQGLSVFLTTLSTAGGGSGYAIVTMTGSTTFQLFAASSIALQRSVTNISTSLYAFLVGSSTGTSTSAYGLAPGASFNFSYPFRGVLWGCSTGAGGNISVFSA